MILVILVRESVSHRPPTHHVQAPHHRTPWSHVSVTFILISIHGTINGNLLEPSMLEQLLREAEPVLLSHDLCLLNCEHPLTSGHVFRKRRSLLAHGGLLCQTRTIPAPRMANPDAASMTSTVTSISASRLFPSLPASTIIASREVLTPPTRNPHPFLPCLWQVVSGSRQCDFRRVS